MPVPLLAGKWGDELAGGELIQGAEAAGEFGVAQAALAVERSEKLFGGALPLLRVAIQTARNKVTVGIAAGLRAWHDMIEAASAADELAQTIKAAAALAGVDGSAQRMGSPEIRLPEAEVTRRSGRVRGCGFRGTQSGNLFGEQHAHDVVRLAVAFD